MTKYLAGLLFLQLSFFGTIFTSQENERAYRIAIVGLGERSNHLLWECLQISKNVQVVAICDDRATDSINFFANKLSKRNDTVLDAYRKCVHGAALYPDTQEGIQQFFANHQDVDWVFLTSPNYKHFRHLNTALETSACRNLYLEKPLFKDLNEFNSFDPKNNDANILIGLTLRYATMTKIVAQKLQEYKDQLGELQRVNAWERVRFCQGLTSFLMSWRKYISLSGGMLLEKSIHDLDLAFFFIQSLGIDLQEIHVSTESAHRYFKQSQKERILQELLHNDALKPTLVGRELAQFQPVVSFSFDHTGAIDWAAVLDDIFKNIPNDEAIESSDIISDYHKLSAVFKTADNKSINFELEVDLGGFRPETQRGMKFVFEHGEVIIDVMESVMHITVPGNIIHTFDLQTNNSDHADGDEYIAQALLGVLAKGQNVATFNDPVVQLASVMGVVSERQSLLKDGKDTVVKKMGNRWSIVA
jgi:predicted dehydrogenase